MNGHYADGKKFRPERYGIGSSGTLTKQTNQNPPRPPPQTQKPQTKMATVVTPGDVREMDESDQLRFAQRALAWLAEVWPLPAELRLRETGLRLANFLAAHDNAMQWAERRHGGIREMVRAVARVRRICRYSVDMRTLARRAAALTRSMQLRLHEQDLGADNARVVSATQGLIDDAVRRRQRRQDRIRDIEARLPSGDQFREWARAYLGHADTALFGAAPVPAPVAPVAPAFLRTTPAPMPVPVTPEFLLTLFGAAAAPARRAPPPVRAPAAFLAPVPVPVSDAVFEKQTRVVHTYEGREPPNCAVCLEACQPGKTRRLPCGHDYHEDCIKPWFRTNPRCPTCRHDAREGDPPVVAPAPAAPAAPAPVPSGMTRCNCCNQNYKHYKKHLLTQKHERNAAAAAAAAPVVAV